VHPVEAVGELVQRLGEQVAVAVQRDRGRLVAQVMLHRLDARPFADEQARAGVAKVMDPQRCGKAGGRGLK
jgi:hypothetical protein